MMNRRNFLRLALTLAVAVAALALPPRERATTAAAAAQPASMGVNGFYAANRAQQGRSLQAAVVIDVPEGYHIVGSRKVETFIPTAVTVSAPRGVRTGPLSYPRGIVRQFQFGSRKVSLPFYEGRNVVRFNVTFPADFPKGETELRARVRYQACKGETECYPPRTAEITMPIAVVGADEPVRRINSQFFGGRK